MYCAPHVSGIPFIMYAQRLENRIIFKFLGERNPKTLETTDTILH